MTDINTETQAADAPEATENLDDFSAAFFAADKPAAEKSEEADTDPDDGVTSQEDEADLTPDEGEPDPDSEEDDGDEPEQKGKKKSRFQERIDDMTHKLREKERLYEAEKQEREALKRQLEEAIAKIEKSAPQDEPAAKPQNTKTEDGLVEPTADDLDEDGNPRYPLGEFDPKLLRDLTRYDRAVERAHEAKIAAEARAEAEKIEQFNAVQAEWNTKVNTAKETYPDYVEKGQQLLDELGDVPPDYAVYLTQNIMSMEYGPDVFYYLADHPEEARAIVNSSPEKALNRLGRIEARFEIAADERSGKETKLRVTKAPEPPATRTRGSNAQTNDDPDDLDAFALKLFKKA